MKRVRSEDGARVRLEGLPYTQVPDAALRLSGTAFKLLGRLQRLAGHASSCEADDQDLAGWIRRTTPTVQRAFRELEAVGLVERRRRHGRRRIVLLYTLAGREAAPAKMINALITQGQKSEASALIENDQSTDQGRSMHSSKLSSRGAPFEEEREEEQQQRAAASPRDVVVSLSPPESEDEEAPPRRPAFLSALVADLAAALTSPTAKRTAAGTPPKDPRQP